MYNLKFHALAIIINFPTPLNIEYLVVVQPYLLVYALFKLTNFSQSRLWDWDQLNGVTYHSV